MNMITSLRCRSVSLATALTIAITFVCGIDLFFLSNFQNQTIENIFSDMNEQLVKSNSTMIAHRINMYLDTPAAASKLLSHVIKYDEHISPSGIEEELHHLMTVDFSDSLSLSRISFASADGSYTAFSRDEQNHHIYLIKSGTQGEKGLITYGGDNDQSGVIHRHAGYNVLTRPWFVQARMTRHAFWSDAARHPSFDNGEVITWRQPVINTSEQFLGVISVDVQPTRIAAWLEKMMHDEAGQVVLLDQQGHYIAASGSITPAILDEIRARQSDTLLNTATPVLSPAQGHNLMLMRNVRDNTGMLNWTLAILTPDDPWSQVINRYNRHNILGFSVIIFIGMLIVILIIQQLTRPLQNLISRVHLIGSADWPHPRQHHFTEVNALARALDTKSVLINKLIETLRRQLERDSETGLLTHMGLRHQLPAHPGRNMTALIHLTNYSALTNLLGPEYGHHLLSRLIEHLTMILPPSCLFSREEMDKLLVVFPEGAKVEQHQWQELLAALFTSEQLQPASENETLLFNGNTALVYEPVTPERFNHIVLNAGIALDYARKQGNGTLSVFTAAMHDAGLHTIELHKQLHQGLEQNEFYLVMQPIVRLAENVECREGECLVRWENPTLGFVAPDTFISLAEKTGLILKLGDWIIEMACRELAQFILRGAPEDFKLHINISPLQLIQPDFSAKLLACIRQYHLNGKNICVEITESMMLNDDTEVIHHLTVLRDAGVTVSLDDFGSGYSNLSYLHTLPFDQLKIDRQFVRDLLSSPRSEKVIASVLSLSKAFRVPLVAEGIEDDETGEKLQQMGCQLAQGYHYGRPQRFENWNVTDGLFYL